MEVEGRASALQVETKRLKRQLKLKDEQSRMQLESVLSEKATLSERLDRTKAFLALVPNLCLDLSSATTEFLTGHVVKGGARAEEVKKAFSTVVRDVCMSTLNADRASLFIVDHARGEMWTQVNHGIDPLRMDMSSGIVGHVASTGSMVNIADAYADPRFDPTADLENGYKTRSVLCVPVMSTDMLSAGLPCGVLQVINKRTVAAGGEDGEDGEDEEDGSSVVPFSEADISALKDFAEHISIAVEHSQMLAVERCKAEEVRIQQTVSMDAEAKHTGSAGELRAEVARLQLSLELSEAAKARAEDGKRLLRRRLARFTNGAASPGGGGSHSRANGTLSTGSNGGAATTAGRAGLRNDSGDVNDDDDEEEDDEESDDGSVTIDDDRSDFDDRAPLRMSPLLDDVTGDAGVRNAEDRVEAARKRLYVH